MPIAPKKYMNEVRTQELITQIKEACKPKPKIVTWSDGTDEQICAIVEALDNGVLTTEEIGWEVGDKRTISLRAIEVGDYNYAHAAQTVDLVIMDIRDYNGVGHFIVGFDGGLAEGEVFNKGSSYSDLQKTGWHDSRLRQCVDRIFDDMMPIALQPIFKEFTVTSATRAADYSYTNPSGITDQNCKMSLFAEKEVFGTKTNSQDDEFNSSKVLSQIEWYKTSSNIMKQSNNLYYWWLRSPCREPDSESNYTDFCSAPTIKTGGTVSSGAHTGNNRFMVAPFGVI